MLQKFYIDWLKIVLFITSVNSFNIMILYDKENTMTRQALMAALDYVSRSPLDVRLDSILQVESENCDGETFYNNACTFYNSHVQAGKGPHLVIDITMCPNVSDAARDFLNNVGLPSVSTSHQTHLSKWMSEEISQDVFIQFVRPLHTVLKVIQIISSTYQLSNLALFHDKEFNNLMYKGESLLQDFPSRRVIINSEMSLEELRHKMNELRELDIFNYFILGSLMSIKNVMDSVECDEYFNNKLFWYLITQENGQLNHFCKNMTALLIKPHPGVTNREKFDQIRSFYSLEPHSELDSAFYFNLIVKSVLAFRSFLESNSWIMQNASQRLCGEPKNQIALFEQTVHFMYYFKEVFEPVIFAPLYLNESNGRGFMDFSMKLEQMKSDEMMESVGFWKPTHQYINYVRNASIKAPRNLYKIVVVLQNPFVMRNIDDTGAENFTGYCIDLMNDISKLADFDYDFYVSPDNSFGIMDEKGQWNGLIKELIDKKADIGLSSLSVTAEREIVVDFTIPFYDMVGTTILMKKHTPKSSHFKFLTIIERDVWLCILLIYIIASLLLWMFDQFNSRNELLISGQNWTPQQLDEIISENFSIKDFLWFCMVSLTPQGSSHCCSSFPSYITMGTWCLFGMLVISSYTANLAALLTVSRLDSTIQSLSDLAQQSRIHYAPINGSSGMNHFKRMAAIEKRLVDEWKNMTMREEGLAVWEPPILNKYSQMWASMLRAGMPATQDDAVARVLASPSTSSGFAYIGDGTNMRYQVLIHCDVKIVGEEFFKIPLAVAVQKNSPLKDTLNKALAKLQRQRRLEKLKEIWWDENPERKICNSRSDLTDERTYLTNIGGVYSLIILGLLLACFTLVFEYYNPKHFGSRPYSSNSSSSNSRANSAQSLSLPFHRWDNHRVQLG